MPALKYHHDRLTQDLSREIASAIVNDVRDPRIPSVVTVVEVHLGDDTRNATVMVSVLAGTVAEKRDAVEAINHAASYIQGVVAKKVKMKHFPKLYFKLDRGLDRSNRINELLNGIKDDLV